MCSERPVEGHGALARWDLVAAIPEIHGVGDAYSALWRVEKMAFTGRRVYALGSVEVNEELR
jgi:hypothetical protein